MKIISLILLAAQYTEMQNDWFSSSEFSKLGLNGNEFFKIEKQFYRS